MSTSVQTIIELERMRIIKPESGFSGSGYWFRLERLVFGNADWKYAGAEDEIDWSVVN